MAEFVQEYPIRLGNVAANYKAQKDTILADFQECFATFCADNKIAAYDVIKDNLIWVVSNINVQFFDELPLWREKLRVKIWVSEVKKLRAYLDFRVYHNEDLVAEGDGCFFLLDATTRRPKPIDKVIEPLGIVNKRVFENHDRRELFDFKDKVCENDLTVNFNDLDFNGHVNNLSYVSWAYASVPEEFLNDYDVENVSIHFLKECFYRDKIKVVFYKKDDKLKFEILKDSSLVCQIDMIAKKYK